LGSFLNPLELNAPNFRITISDSSADSSAVGIQRDVGGPLFIDWSHLITK